MLIHFALVKGRDGKRSRDGNGNIPVIWVKTDAGRVEMQTRALIKERARRNLLLLIDGAKSEEMLLANLAGITAQDFQELRKLDLIAPAAGAVTVGHPGRAAAFEATRPILPQRSRARLSITASSRPRSPSSSRPSSGCAASR